MSITYILQSLDTSLSRIELAIRAKSQKHAEEVAGLRQQLELCQAECRALEEKIDRTAERIDQITARLQNMIG